MEEKSLFGGRWSVRREKLFHNSNKNKAPRRLGLSLRLCSVVFYLEPRNEAVFGCLSQGTLGQSVPGVFSVALEEHLYGWAPGYFLVVN